MQNNPRDQLNLVQSVMEDQSDENPDQNKQDGITELIGSVSRITTRSISSSSSISRHDSGSSSSSDKYRIVIEGLVVQEGQKVTVPMNCIFAYMQNNMAQKRDVKKQIKTIKEDAEITDRKTEAFKAVCEISKSVITNPITGVSSIHKGMKTSMYKTKEQKDKDKKKQQERRANEELGKKMKKRKQHEDEADTSDDDDAPAARTIRKVKKKES